ncbi:MAG: hypothetical protein AB1941_14800 [Gemmatimonadota bacterium]
MRDAATNEPRLDLDVRIFPRVEIAHDTVQEIRRLLLSPTNCGSDTTVIDRHSVPPRWKIRTVGNPVVPTAQVQRFVVEGVQQEGDSAVQVRLRLLGSSDTVCPTVPATYEYALQIFAERLEPQVLDGIAIPSLQLTRAKPAQKLSSSRPLSDPRIRDRRWLYRVYVSGRTRTTQVLLELSNARPDEAGIRTNIGPTGELTIDASSALLP